MNLAILASIVVQAYGCLQVLIPSPPPTPPPKGVRSISDDGPRERVKPGRGKAWLAQSQDR